MEKKVEYTGQGTSKQSGGSILTMASLSISTNITLSILNWDGGGNRTTVWKEPILIQNSHSPWTWTAGLTSAGSGTHHSTNHLSNLYPVWISNHISPVTASSRSLHFLIISVLPVKQLKKAFKLKDSVVNFSALLMSQKLEFWVRIWCRKFAF